MTDSYEEQITDIDIARMLSIRGAVKEAKSLATMALRLLGIGKTVGIFRRHKQYHKGHLKIRDCPNWKWYKQTKVYYRDKLVLHFHNSFPYEKHYGLFGERRYLQFYDKGGEWEDEMMLQYRKESSIILFRDFGITGKICEWFDNDEGSCTKFEYQICPCEIYKEVE